MKIMMISWEYPPKCVGGLSNHLYHICNSLSDKGHDVYIITSREGNASEYEKVGENIYVYRVSSRLGGSNDFSKWVANLNFSMIEKGIEILNSVDIDIIHAHDWSAAYSSIILSKSFNKKLVITMHSTEYGRNNGINGELQTYIYNVEKMMCDNANSIIVCSSYMKNEIIEIYKQKNEIVIEIPNGIAEKHIDINMEEFKELYVKKDDKILFFVGRHVYEKGIQTLIEAVAKLIDKYPIYLFISGLGPYTEDLKRQVANLKIENRVKFIGYISEELKDKLYSVADISIFPSLYEPFGIVALEAMTLGCPVIVSDVGGLGEIVTHRENGMKFHAGSPENLVYCIRELLENRELREKIKVKAKKEVSNKYTWSSVAEKTIRVYSDLLEG